MRGLWYVAGSPAGLGSGQLIVPPLRGYLQIKQKDRTSNQTKPRSLKTGRPNIRRNVLLHLPAGRRSRYLCPYSGLF